MEFRGGEYIIQWFEGDVSATSIESVCINYEEDVCINYEEELRGTEYESDSDIHSDSDEEYFSLAQKHKQILRHLQAIIYCMKVIKPQ